MPDYTADAVEAARSVMLELVRLLGEYRDDMVIIGGWASVFGHKVLCSAAVSVQNDAN